MEIITGGEAMDRMKALKALPGHTFGLIFITCNLSSHKRSGEVRKYERCRMRTAMMDEGLNTSADHYLYFTDMESEEPKQCFKKLIRKVSFNNIWYQVKWFN